MPWPDGPPPGDWEEPEEEALFLEVGLANVDTDGLQLDFLILQVVLRVFLFFC